MCPPQTCPVHLSLGAARKNKLMWNFQEKIKIFLSLLQAGFGLGGIHPFPPPAVALKLLMTLMEERWLLCLGESGVGAAELCTPKLEVKEQGYMHMVLLSPGLKRRNEKVWGAPGGSCPPIPWAPLPLCLRHRSRSTTRHKFRKKRGSLAPAFLEWLLLFRFSFRGRK